MQLLRKGSIREEIVFRKLSTKPISIQTANARRHNIRSDGVAVSTLN